MFSGLSTMAERAQGLGFRVWAVEHLGVVATAEPSIQVDCVRRGTM